MSKQKKTKKNPQADYRRKRFKFPQYWNLNYTERNSEGLEKDFKTIIFAQSYNLAVHILKEKLRESDPFIKVKSLHGFMFHKEYRSSISQKARLGIEEWDKIRKSAFPNQNDFLFKVEVPRPDGYSNRFNKTDKEHLKTIGFAKGESNWSVRNRKGKSLPESERSNKIWNGTWVDWDPDIRQLEKNKLIEALVKNNNSRTHAADSLGCNRNKIYKLFKKFPEIDFAKEYPPPPPGRNFSKNPRLSAIMKESMKRRIENGEVPFAHCQSPEIVAKRIANMTKSKREKRKANLKEMIPKIDEALKKTNGNRTKAAMLLDLTPSVFGKLMIATKETMNWSERYPSKFSNTAKRKKNASD